MEFIRLTDSNHAMYHQAMDLYKASFPIHEQGKVMYKPVLGEMKHIILI